MNSPLQRHVGRMKNTGSAVAVVMLTIPQRDDHALVVEYESLPPKYRDSFADLIFSDAQKTTDLMKLLHGRSFVTGENMLNCLHNNGYLRAVPVDSIVMNIAKGHTMPLKDIVAAMKGEVGEISAPELPKLGEDVATTPFLSESEAVLSLESATKMVEDAKVLQQKVYKEFPNLKPKSNRGRKKAS